MKFMRDQLVAVLLTVVVMLAAQVEVPINGGDVGAAPLAVVTPYEFEFLFRLWSVVLHG